VINFCNVVSCIIYFAKVGISLCEARHVDGPFCAQGALVAFGINVHVARNEGTRLMRHPRVLLAPNENSLIGELTFLRVEVLDFCDPVQKDIALRFQRSD
jgi:hypothetical protein